MNSTTGQDWLTWAFSPAISAILVTLLVSLSLPVLIHWYLYRKAVSRELPSFLLVGPSGSGKTSLLTLFASGRTSTTHTSQTTYTALCQLPSSIRTSDDQYRSEHDLSTRAPPTLLLLDTPGHGKLRHHALASLTGPSTVKGLIFMVDSARLSSTTGLTEAGEYLHDILLLLQKRHTQGTTSKTPKAIPVLVAANKQDVFTSLPAPLVRSRLEEEIAKVRQTRSKGLLDSGIGMEDDAGGDEERNWLGQYGTKAFQFVQMEEHGVDVKVVGGNVVGEAEEGGVVQDWWTWIGDNM